jgi:hypothetical protein
MGRNEYRLIFLDRKEVEDPGILLVVDLVSESISQKKREKNTYRKKTGVEKIRIGIEIS